MSDDPIPTEISHPPARERLIEAALTHALFDGMNDAAIMAGARDIGMDATLARVHLPGGGADLAAAYHRTGDTALTLWLADSPPAGGVRDRVATAVMQRLALADRELVRSGAAVLALPQHAGLGARLIWESADTIWTGLGDGSHDVNWYSKRATLGTVFAATVLYWLGDDSPDAQQTRRFLDRRIEGLMRFERLKSMARKLPGVGPAADLATGWIQRPGARDVPGRWWSRGAGHAAAHSAQDKTEKAER